MRQIDGHLLWLGHAGDLRDVAALHDAGIVAVIDLAINEPPAVLPREMIYCRLPTIDGCGNEPWLLKCAVEALSGLIRASAPVLVCCSAGLSRSPCIAAAALHLATRCSLADGLTLATQGHHADVSPALWREVQQAAIG